MKRGSNSWKRGTTRVGRVLLAATGALLVASSSAAAAAHPETIGANLRQAPDANFDCTVIPFEFSAPGKGGNSCTWGNPEVPGSALGGLDAPGNGTITQVKLRVGATTGKMQIVILRTLFDPRDLANNECCVAVARSSVFTPVRNGITTLNVRLPVRADSSPTARVDFLDQVALSILEKGVKIPVIDETSLPIQDQPVDNYNTPAMKLGEKQLASDPDGFRLDMQARWVPAK